MAKIVGGIASSHSPTIGFARDTNKQNDPAWAPIFEGYQPIRKWLKEKDPDVMLVIYNDHISSFFFDHYSAFALGVDDSYSPADEGGGPRELPPIKGHTGLARHIATSLVADEFDMSFFQKKPLDHGCFSPLSMMWEDISQWPCAIVPLQVGILQCPVPSPRRCYHLGQSLRKAIESYDEDIAVVVVATGGLSHQVHGERCGFNNTAWDAKFLALIANDPIKLTEMTIAEYATLGGYEGSEIIMWLIMRGALSASVRMVHKSYYLPSMAGIATAILEHQPEPFSPREIQDHLKHMHHQLKGAETLEGTYPYTLERSHKAYRINKFLHRLTMPEYRSRFLADEESILAESSLTGEERDLVRRRDWRAMIHYGVTFFVLEKLGAVVGVSNLHIYAAMRGETLEEFQKTRNVSVQYSVAGG
ncbi:MAG: gallate dioxygenase, partial [Desulfobacteraceae bacterium]|nr:gallate dioxygenase [Desulfobacteraceae bacterium]